MLVCAPHGRDGEVMAQVLLRDGLPGEVVPNFAALVAAVEAGAGAAILAEEALHGEDTAQLSAWLQQQEPWSDFPFVVLMGKAMGVPAEDARVRLSELAT